MSSKDDQPFGTAFPVIVILVSMAFLMGGFILTRQPAPQVRVWLPPVQSRGAAADGGRASSPCSSAALSCNQADPV
ncbi:hypothetical protein QO002_006115 [Pararhizobium capsulatum DSM 1112]|uniref:Uncharacterized protein n=1 Tax=Pararhizobium capsulatum DSM 1112 TaxID=1121113 RepID=A0ABU0C057_9HYPH|nr:hypothetical protein [Pararhizobium capsulatum DSM 1112]